MIATIGRKRSATSFIDVHMTILDFATSRTRSEVQWWNTVPAWDNSPVDSGTCMRPKT